MSTSIEIVAPGIATTVQDAGRCGLAHIGVSPSGFVDPALARMLNRLVGNPPDAAVLETAGGLRIRVHGAAVIASSSAPAPMTVRSADEVLVPVDQHRQWHYLAVRGGIEVPSVLGSRSRDTLSGLGPPPIVAGLAVTIGSDPVGDITTDFAPLAELPHVAHVSTGPRADWFVDGWSDVLTGTNWSVTAASRVGVRLRGARLARSVEGELPSEGLVRGAIQVPPDGDPVMMLADHPTTGGYPVIAVVEPSDVAIVGQHPVGTTLRFRMA